jgi:hypothetical protein
MRAYWPGGHWVDAVGSTMINFGTSRRYAVRSFEPRLRTLHQTFAKPLMITETNTAFDGRVAWLRDLRRMLRRMPWVRSVAWSQLPSRGLAHTSVARQLDWNVQQDPPSAAVLRGIIGDGQR